MPGASVIEWLLGPRDIFSPSRFADWQGSIKQDKNAKNGRRKVLADATACDINYLTVQYAKLHPLKSLKNGQCSTRALKLETYEDSFPESIFSDQETILAFLFLYLLSYSLESGKCLVTRYHQLVTIFLLFWLWYQYKEVFLLTALPVVLWVASRKHLVLRFSSYTVMYYVPLSSHIRYLNNISFISWVFSKFLPSQ